MDSVLVEFGETWILFGVTIAFRFYYRLPAEFFRDQTTCSPNKLGGFIPLGL